MKMRLLLILAAILLHLKGAKGVGTSTTERVLPPFLCFLWSSPSPAPRNNSQGHDDLQGSWLRGPC